jgi:hypothetical protein
VSKPRVYIVPIEWQISGAKTNADNSVHCVEKQAYDKAIEALKFISTKASIYEIIPTAEQTLYSLQATPLGSDLPVMSKEFVEKQVYDKAIEALNHYKDLTSRDGSMFEIYHGEIATEVLKELGEL